MKRTLLYVLVLACLCTPAKAIYTVSEYKDEVGYIGSLDPSLDPLYQTIASLNESEVVGTGQTFYVDSGVSGGGATGADWTNAAATIDAAVGLCTASRGDIIYVAQGHAETLTAATGLVCDVAGISIIGIGHGSLIPTISLGTSVEAAISVTGANTRLSNLKVVSALADVESGINLSATADGSIIDNCSFADGAANLEMLVDVNVVADCDNIRILNNQFYAFAASNTTNAIVCLGGSDNSVIAGNLIYGTYTAGGVDTSTAASTNLTVVDNIIGCIDAVAYAGKAETTGLFARNLFGANTTSIAAAVTGTDAMFCWENYTTGALNASGIIDPAVDSDG